MKYLIQRLGFLVMLTTSIILFYQFKFTPLVYYIIFSTTISLTIFLEKWMPYHKKWKNYQKDLKQDIIYALSTIILTPVVKVIAIYSVVLIGSSFLTIKSFVSEQDFITQFVVALILSGLAPYWYHRWSHTRSTLLWKIHAIHHAPKKLYWLNAFRFHPINSIINAFLSLFPLLLLGFNQEVVILTGFINNYIDILNHTNINFKIGVLNYIFNMNEVHRWHHSSKHKEGNSNYSGGALILWDLVFNTYYRPKKALKSIGLFSDTKASFPYTCVLAQVSYPFFKLKKCQ